MATKTTTRTKKTVDPDAFRAEMTAKFPVLARLSGLSTSDHPTAFEVDMRRAWANGKMSPKQVQAAIKMFERADKFAQTVADRKAATAHLVDAGVMVPIGKLTFTGTIVTTKIQDTNYGAAYKMIVETEQGWKVWGTIPGALFSALPYMEDMKGRKVTLTATLDRSDKDQLFGFMSRPRLVELHELVAA